nr:MAG TPA: hypothetical protein [Caudoviricetes sp.]
MYFVVVCFSIGKFDGKTLSSSEKRSKIPSNS